MKKTMISAIILLPLILLLILTINTAVVSLTTHVYVEDVSIVDAEKILYLYKESKDHVPQEKIETEVFPLISNNKSIMYSSDNEDVIKVDNDGVVYGLEFGETYVNATSVENNTLRDKRKVVVTALKPLDIEIKNGVDVLFVGDEYDLNCNVLPTDVSNTSVLFESSDPSIIEISQTGHIKAQKYGKATITVKAIGNSEVKKSIDILVYEQILDAYIIDNVDVVTGNSQEHFPDIVFVPEHTYAYVDYVSSNENVAKVDSNGLITFNEIGEVTIKALVKTNGDSIKEISKKYNYTGGFVNSVTITGLEEYNFEDDADKPLDIDINIYPSVYDQKNIEITFSNENVLEYRDNSFYIVGGGTTSIIIKYNKSNGENESTIHNVKVNKKATGLTINNDDISSELFYTFDKNIILNVIKEPLDSTYDVFVNSNTEGVVVDGNAIHFSGENEYEVADISITTNDSELEKNIKVVYVDKNKIEVIDIDSFVNETLVVLPNSASTEKNKKVAFYINKDNVTNFEVLSNGVIQEVVCLNDIGLSEFDINVNGEFYKTIKLNSYRKVERITDVVVSAMFDTNEVLHKNEDGIYYTAANKIKVNYNLFPENTSIKNAKIEIIKGNATINNNEITFGKQGSVTVRISIDNVEVLFDIYTTYLHPNNTTEISSAEELGMVFKGSEIPLNKIVKEIKPYHAESKYITYKVSNNLIKTQTGFKAKESGEAVITVNIETDIDVITKTLVFTIFEEAKDIELKKNYFVVNSNSYIISEKDYDIIPLTSNYKNTIKIDSITPGVDVFENEITYNGEGLVEVSLTLENGNSKTISILFAKTTQVINVENNIIPVLEKGEKFIVNVPNSVARNYKGINLINGLSYTNGIFTITSAIKNIDDKSSAEFEVAGTIYKFKGIISPKSVKIQDIDYTFADKTATGYITALKNIKLNSVVTETNATFKNVIYSVVEKDIASIDNNGNIVFNKAGKITITAFVEGYEQINDSIEIESTFGYAKGVDVNIHDITLNYDNNKEIDIRSNIVLFPSQASVDELIKIETNSSMLTIDPVNQFKIIACEGGNFVVKITCKNAIGGYDNITKIPVKVNRKATGILLDGVKLEGDKTLTTENGLIMLNTKSYPTDANLNTNINLEIISGKEAGMLTPDKTAILFTEANKEVKIKISLEDNSCSYIITCLTTQIVTIIDVDQEKIVMPYESKVMFDSNLGNSYVVNTPYLNEVGTIKDKTIYKANRSGITNIVVGGVDKQLIITKIAENIGDITITDYNNTLKTEENIILGTETHFTAAISIPIKAKEHNEYNSDGSIVNVKLEVINPEIASIVDGNIVFLQYGLAKIKATIDAENYFGKYTEEAIYNVYSTFGIASDFVVDCPSEIVDNFTVDLTNKISINKPNYGTNNIKFKITSDNIFTTNGLVITATNTGKGSIVVSSYNGSLTKDVVININVEKNIDEIKFEKNSIEIMCDYTKGDTYVINPTLLSNNSFKPTIKNLTYSIVSGNATLNNNVVTFMQEYDVVKVKTESKNHVEAYLVIVKVPELTTIVDMNSKMILDNNTNYVFESIGKEFSNKIENNENINIVDNLTGTVSFNHGGNYTYLIKNTNVEVVVTERVSSINTINESILTSKKRIDLNSEFSPSFLPNTAYTKDGPVKVNYQLISGDAEILNNELIFNSKGVAEVKIICANKEKIVMVESSFGYVKSAKWLRSEYQFDYSKGGFTISLSDFEILPKDVETSMYRFAVSDIASINGRDVSFIRGGNTNIQLIFDLGLNEKNSINIPLKIHYPVTNVGFVFDNKIVNKIVTNGTKYKLDYVVDNELASPYKVDFICDEKAYVTQEGVVSIKANNTSSIVTMKLTNSDGSIVEKQIDVFFTDKEIIKVSDNTVDNQEFIIESDKSYIIYALPVNEKTVNIALINTGIVDVDGNGIVTILSSGKANIKISSESYNKQINISVHKLSTGININPIIVNDSLLTSKARVDFMANILPEDSKYMKDIEYIVNNNNAHVENGVLVFDKAGEVIVTIQVKYNGKIEFYRNVNVKSTLGKVMSYDLLGDGKTLQSSYMFEDLNDKHIFTITNILPTDYVLSDFILNNDGQVIEIVKNVNEFELISKERGEGSIILNIDNVNKVINYIAKLKVKDINVSIENKQIIKGNQYLAMQDKLSLKTSVVPANANDTSLTWVITNGGSYDSNTGTLNLPNLGIYNITLKSHQETAVFAFKIEKIDKFDVFELTYKENTVGSNQADKLNIKLSYSDTSMIIKFTSLPENFIGNIKSENIKVTVSSDITFNISANEIVLLIPESNPANPGFKGNASVSISTATINIDIMRDGIEKVLFLDHDNNLDNTYGLQEMRLFGNKSYYGGIKNYYDMPIEITPSFIGAKPIFETSSNLVTVDLIDGKARVNFGSFTGNSFEDIKNDKFDKTVTVIAKDAAGKKLASYTFHLVQDAVNIFDQEGYMNTNKVVLHTNFGGNEEKSLDKFTLFDNSNPRGKEIIYGNGFTINYYAKNNTFDPKGKDKNVFTSISNLINTTVKGGNFDKTKANYHNCFGPGFTSYSIIQQTYKGIYAGANAVIKKSLFRYIKDMSIQISNEDRNVYIEDIISIDGGNTAIECQCNAYYLKGFIDVYNFKNADSLKELSGKFVAKDLIKDIEKLENGRYCCHGLNDDNKNDTYFNVVLFCGKNISDDRKVFFWNGTEYVQANEFNGVTADGIKSFRAPLVMMARVFTYPTDGRFTLEHQRDNAYLARQFSKLKRSYDGSPIN